VGLNALKSLNLTNVYPNKNNKNNKVKSKPLELRSQVKNPKKTFKQKFKQKTTTIISRARKFAKYFEEKKILKKYI
jgi:hypothetical protein